MGINKDRTYRDSAALRPRLSGLPRPVGTHTPLVRESTWGANRKARKSNKISKINQPKDVGNHYNAHESKDKEGGLAKSFGRGALILTVGTASLAAIFGVGYAVSQFTSGEGVDLNADQPEGETTHVYRSVTEGVSSIVPPVANVPPAAEQPVTTVASAPEAVPMTTAPIVVSAVELPNPLAFSVSAGSVVCIGEVITVPITADTRQFVALANATGEPWDQGVAPHSDDENLFRELLIANGFASGTPPALPYELRVRNGCTGLEQ